MRILIPQQAPAILLFLSLMLSCTGCVREYLPDTESLLVVEGWIEDGGHPIVMVTSSVPTSLSAVSSDMLADHVVRWAKVSVSDGDSTVVLTGKPDKDYLTRYIYTTARIQGESGKQYTLKVSYHGMEAEATTSIPESTVLESVTPKEIDGVGSGRFSLEASFVDKEGKDYYRFFSMVRGKETAFIPCLLGTFDDVGMSGRVCCSLLPGNIVSAEEFAPYYADGDDVTVKLCTMDSVTYAFWKDYDDLVSLSKNPLFPVTLNPASNMEGALGYWAGYGSSTVRVIVCR